MTQKDVKMSLIRQLELRGMSAEFYMDLVNDYIYYWSLKKKLIADIKSKGLRYETVNGNGMTVEKANESVVNLQKTTATMLKILADLKLKEPVPEPENPTDVYLYLSAFPDSQLFLSRMLLSPPAGAGGNLC